MPDQPSYVDLLNALALGERRGGALLSAWRAVTTDPHLAHVLEVVTIRQKAHAAAMIKRLCELGYSLVETPSDSFRQCLDLAGSNASDGEKFARLLGYGTARDSDDPLARVFEDRTIDPATGALLGAFIAESRDSDARLRHAWRNQAGPPPEISDQELLAEVTQRLDRLARTLEELKQLRR